MTVTVEPELFCPTTTFPKAIEEGVAVTAVTPVPVRLTVCGLPLPVSVTERTAVRKPRAAGVKVTEIVQLLPAPSVEGLSGQLFVCL